jgi:diguanylate cyclase (GGDEF)-like protein
MVPRKKTKYDKIIRERQLFQQQALLYRQLMEAMREGLPQSEIFKRIITVATRGLGYDRAGIFLAEKNDPKIKLVMGINAKGKYEKQAREFTLTRSKGKEPISDVFFGHRRNFVMNLKPGKGAAARTKTRMAGMDPGVENHAIVPLEVGRGKIIGLLAVDNLFSRRPISSADLSSLMDFATQAGLAIQSIQMHHKILNLTIMDTLTEVFNLRYFDRALEAEMKRSQRYSNNFGLLYIDADHFKAVNDQWGHGVGDKVLKHLALVLRAGVRNIDTVARIGGEEFAIILPETTQNGTVLTANRLLQNVRAAEFPTETRKLTVSIGVISFPRPCGKAEAIKTLADQSLYTAKREGRNRVGPFVPFEP